eukprot:16431466-Heterocapsa_arctica.AAC.1
MARYFTAKAVREMDFGNIIQETGEQPDFESKAYADPIWEMEVAIQHVERGEGACLPGEDFVFICGNMEKLSKDKECYACMAMKNTVSMEKVPEEQFPVINYIAKMKEDNMWKYKTNMAKA